MKTSRSGTVDHPPREHRTSAPDAPPRAPKRDLLDLAGMDPAEITALLDAAARHAAAATGDDPPPLAGRVVANLFFEDSTRTRCSFSIAAQRLGAAVVDLFEEGSSIRKGETLADTARSIEAMGVDAIVVRHAASGAAHLLARAVACGVINAGDGRHAHPTQALLDLLALRERLGAISGRRVAIVGDIGNSRVARSAVHGLVAMGAEVILIGPPTLVPRSFESLVDRPGGRPGAVGVAHALDPELPTLDAIMMLRVQLERQAGSAISNDFHQLYGLTAERMRKLPGHAIVMHPGPINRGVEIDSEAADHPGRSVILRQVALGVAVRMAVLEWALRDA
ncbi:MAG TPA: aspartate carbamoyltransferase catalytic subunit [Phycisphaerales bacterium]|nr:aspartate carbamoyltransferase catalytic subunit [Phycisphaerales bacterium]HMP36061.1 aspartate carbamoyltransferase catalytic subunit [Phycisphaerales bacterium]